MHPRDLRIEHFTYDLPDERIARYPLAMRDASKLLIYDEGKIGEDTYRNIAQHIPAGALMVFNQTKVVHARLLFKKPTGGVIEVFCLEPGDEYADVHTAMLQTHKVQWQCMIGGASKWKHGMVLHLVHNGPDFTIAAKIVSQKTGSYILELEWGTSLTFAEVLHYAGNVPLPPYLHRQAEASDEERYQTIYAKEEGSVAAPTAGLHFTEQVMDSIEQKHIDKAFVTLHVGAGTFKPVKSETMEGHDMHAEWIEVDREAIDALITYLDKGIVAVGTTSARTLESLYWIGNQLAQGKHPDFAGLAVTQWEPYEETTTVDAKTALQAIAAWMDKEAMQRLITRTQIIIAPGYQYRIIKGLVTNFHQPQSTLLLLVAAMIGDAWQRVYDYALNNDFRFLSYGDGCLLWSHQ